MRAGENMIEVLWYNKVEMKLYELLGVKIFQKMVFGLEKIIHRKDGETNENYHFRGDGSRASVAGDFTKYLFYNGSIHVRNSIFLSLYLFVKYVIFHTWNMISWILLITLIKDLYCVMLQRYNYLRIKKFKAIEQIRMNKKKERFAKKLETVSVESTSMEKEINLIRKMKKQLSQNGVIELEESDLESLKALKNALN